MCNSVFIIRILSNLVSVCFYRRLGVCHRDSETSELDHCEVIKAITDGNNFFLFYMNTL